MNENIDFMKKLDKLELENKVKWLDQMGVRTRVQNEKLNLEKLISLIPKNNFFHNVLNIGEDEFRPINYCFNISKDSKFDLFYWVNCDLTNENFMKIQNLYFDIFGRYLQDDSV